MNAIARLVLSIAVLSVTPLAAQAADNDPIKVGIAMPISGSNGDYFQRQLVNPAILAIDNLNARGGVLGRKIEYVIEDHKASAPVGASVVQKLVDIDKVNVIFTTSTAATLAMLPIAAKAQVPVLAAAYDSRVAAHEWGFQCVMPNATLGKAYANYIYSSLNAKTVNWVVENNVAILESLKFFQAEYERLGGKIIDIEKVNVGSNDLRGELTKVKAMSADALAMQFSAPQAYAIALKQMAEIGYKPKAIIGYENMISPQLWSIAGDLANGIPYLTGFVDSAWAEKQFMTRFPYKPEALAAQIYDCVNIYFDAMSRAKTTDTVKVRDFLRKMTDHKGAAGTWGYNGSGETTIQPSVAITKSP